MMVSNVCMRRSIAAVVGLTIGLLPGAARAANPQLGGEMKHIFITLFAPNQTLYHLIQDGADERVMLYDYGETYAGDAAVLNGTHYAARYGWLPDGNWNIPAGRGIFIVPLSQSPGLRVYGQDDFAPIFGTDGSDPVWAWDTTMVHNWYAVDQCGWYQATYEVYVGFPDGMKDPAYTPTQVRLIFQVAQGDGELLGDHDADGDTDLADFARLQACYGADGDLPIDDVCGCYDTDADSQIDTGDAIAFTNTMSGP
jgi:hypothetical protein